MSSTFKVQRICQHCSKEFTARTTSTRFCSKKCNAHYYKAQIRNVKVEASNKETERQKNQPFENLKTKEFLTIKDAATLLNSSIRTVYRLVEQGNIKAVNIAQRKTLIKRSDIDQLFNVNLLPPPPVIVPEQKTEPKQYSIEECYNLTEIQNKFNISEKGLHDIIKRHNIPKFRKGWFAYVPKTIIDKLLS